MGLAEKLEHASKADASTGCIVWTRGKAKAGYGMLRHGGKTFTTHRLAYELARGPIPDGMFVCHSCDNPACVNPDHLFLGTPADNMRDMHDKGRGSVGERHGGAKLTADDVAAIRAAVAAGALQREVADQYGLRQGYVSRIVNWLIWRTPKP
jgi:hypothetical protein